MTMTQAEALREVITFINGTRNYRIGSIEFDHSQEPTGVHVNCIVGKSLHRFKVENVNERGLHILKNDGVSMIDWGGRLCLETDFDPEGNSVNATIEDNAGITIACSVLYAGVYEMKPAEEKQAKPDKDKLTGYAHASGTAPYDKYCDTLLTIGNYCYEINVDRIDFFYHFVDKTVEIEFEDNGITLKCGDKRTRALVIEVCDAVDHSDAGLTEAEAEELYHRVAKTTPLLD